MEERRAHGGSAEAEHVPVLLEEVLDFLAPAAGGRYLDGTVGLGGHARGILERSGGEAFVLGLDRDERALATARGRLAAAYPGRVHLVHERYSRFQAVLDELGWQELDGALLDLGVSSLQLDDPDRGFSFLADGPLDMRMDPSGGEAPASRLVNMAGVEELRRLIRGFGEDPLAGRIARAIGNARSRGAITRTLELAAIVEAAYPARMRATARNHPATRTFQALRMAVNRELDELEAFLAGIAAALKAGGRVAVISFHSLEDRLVKRSFRDQGQGCRCPRTIPVCVCGGRPVLQVLTKKPVTPAESEIARNSRARSAKLRVAEKLPSAEVSV